MQTHTSCQYLCWPFEDQRSLSISFDAQLKEPAPHSHFSITPSPWCSLYLHKHITSFPICPSPLPLAELLSLPNLILSSFSFPFSYDLFFLFQLCHLYQLPLSYISNPTLPARVSTCPSHWWQCVKCVNCWCSVWIKAYKFLKCYAFGVENTKRATLQSRVSDPAEIHIKAIEMILHSFPPLES